MAAKNSKKRTREEIVRDVAFILSMRQSLHYGTIHSVLHSAVWAWSEYDGKLKGCKYWSKKALEYENDKSRLTHEHLVPRNVIIKKLYHLETAKPTAAEIFDILSVYCIGVVLTREEDKLLDSRGLRSKMPNDWNWEDPWQRYIIAELQHQIEDRCISQKLH